MQIPGAGTLISNFQLTQVVSNGRGGQRQSRLASAPCSGCDGLSLANYDIGWCREGGSKNN